MTGTTSGSPQRSDEEVRNAIFIVQARRQTGTGFLALDRQHILTARHVVEGIQPEQEKVFVRNARAKEPYSAVVQQLLENWDVALLRLEKPIEDSAVQPFNLSQQRPAAGTNFSTYGFPVDYGSGWFYGKIGNEEEDRKYTVIFEITFDPATYGGTLEGLSGGPIFDVNNRSSVIGFICEHGPVNYQIGKIEPAAGIYKEIANEIALSGTFEGESDHFPSVETNIHQDWGDAPDVNVFFGRTSELATLEQWILQDQCRLVAIVGMGGMGKTKLSVKLGRGGIGKTDLSLKLARGIQDQFEYVIWRRLLNAPKVTEILTDLIKFLSNQQEVNVADTVDGQIGRLLYYLRQRRCLLILDNVEMILQGGKQAGQYLPGYEEYGQLFRRVAEVPHQSCLLLTSREKPEIAQLETEKGPVRLLELKGLRDIDCKKIFSTIGSFSGSKEEWKKLNRLYNGNPLALELAAHHIKEIFFGNISQFLKEGTPIFTDLQELLVWHFDRLSNSQQEVMYWLAINREPQSVSDLKEDILSPEAKEQVPSTLQLLQRLIPLEKGASGFTLQPVLMEYTTDRFVKQISEEIRSGSMDLLNTHALLKASAKDYVRESQVRLILTPVARSLLAIMSEQEIERKLKSMLATLRETQPHVGSYAAGGLLNLLIQLGFDPSGYDFSYLTVRQGYLQGRNLPGINFVHANLATSVFTDTFSSVLSVAFSPDGKLLAASTVQGEVRAWQIPSGKSHLICQGHIDWAWAVAFSPNGRLLISGGADRTVRLWDVGTGKCLKTLQGHASEVRSVAFSPDGKVIASGSQDKTIRLWETSTGQCLNILEGHPDYIWSVAFSPDGQILASGSEDTTIRLWEASTGECFKILKGDIGYVYSTIFSPDGRILASISADQAIRLWDVGTGDCLKTMQGLADLLKPVTFSAEATIAFSPDGQMLASGSEDQTLRLWNIDTGECLKTIQGYTNPVYTTVFSPDGQMLASGSEDQTVHLWEVSTSRYLRGLRGHLGPVWSIAFSSNGSLLASGSSDRTIRLWEVGSGQYLKTLQGHANRVRSVTFSPDGQILASGSEDQKIKLWKVSTGECFRTLRGHTSSVWSVAFNPAGTILASGSEDRTIRLWEVSTGECLKILEGHTDRIYSIAFSPDGSLLASEGSDRTIRIWEIGSGQYRDSLQRHTNRIRSIAFSSDGLLLASGSVDGTIHIWGANTSECLKILDGHSDIVWSVSLNPDQKLIVSGSNDGTVKLWDIQTAECLKVLRSARPYEGMNITDVRGLTDTQKATIRALGAIEDEEHEVGRVTISATQHTSSEKITP